MDKGTLVTILSEIPWDVWERIVKNEPEWENMEDFLPRYGFGPFAVLMLVTGLNDYQLKGKAEKNYWPKIRAILIEAPVPESPKHLGNILEPFYERERLSNVKIMRLHKFLDSCLASDIWKSTPEEVAKNFTEKWHKLASTMNQAPHAKTIAFAMKCLGISLLMAGEYSFDFGSVPVPVDSRIKIFTEHLGYLTSNNEIRNTWQIILSELQNYEPRVTMIHLDSLIWQIASLGKDELQNYFTNLEYEKGGNKLCAVLQP